MLTSVKEIIEERVYIVITPVPYVNNILRDSLAFSKYAIPTKTKLTTLILVFTDI